MNSYPFITDQRILKQFHEECLYPLDDHECYLMELVFRNKYMPIKYKLKNGNKSCAKKLITKNDFGHFRRKILELCVPINTYEDDEGKPLDANGFALYIMINPRCNIDSCISLAHRLVDVSELGYPSLDIEVHSQLARNRGSRRYIIIDIDPKGDDDLEEVYTKVNAILGESKTFSIVTKNGIHVLLDKSNIDKNIKNTFYNNIQLLSTEIEGEVEFLSDSMTPIPGTYQGGHSPYIK